MGNGVPVFVQSKEVYDHFETLTWLKNWWKMCVYLISEYIDWFRKENKYKTR